MPPLQGRWILRSKRRRGLSAEIIYKSMISRKIRNSLSLALLDSFLKKEPKQQITDYMQKPSLSTISKTAERKSSAVFFCIFFQIFKCNPYRFNNKGSECALFSLD